MLTSPGSVRLPNTLPIQPPRNHGSDDGIIFDHHRGYLND